MGCHNPGNPARNWFKRLRKELLDIGLKQLASDNCIFVYKKERTIDSNIEASNIFVEKLRKVFELNKTTNKDTFRGMEVKQSEKEITISQEGYIKVLLEKYRMLDCKPVATPIVPR